ncbi:MAG: hypothetical protein IJA07_04785 [Agathobacter sp.]|nr:hypothetical protein [Agathobacter sp.]
MRKIGIKKIITTKKWKTSTKGIFCGLFGVILATLFLMPNIFYGGTTEIRSATDLMKLVETSKLRTIGPDEIYELKADINLGTYEFTGIGSEEHPFCGTFEGNGYTISGLAALQSENTYTAKSGLFVYIDGATIQNFKLEGTNIVSEGKGGIVATKAVNSKLKDITVKNSILDITLTEHVKELPMKAGFAGGLVGYASGCTFYDCEVSDSTIGSNQKNITANIGDGFYLGGLVGIADSSTVVEYSRVKDCKISIDISTEVAALDRTFIHNGGLVGSLRNGSLVIDSFSSANLNTDVEMAMQTAVGVSNYFGGIVASMEGENCGITRCHYSGTQTGTKKNIARGTELAFYMTGICGFVDDANAENISYTYYDYDKLLAGGESSEGVVLTALRRENGANRGESEHVKRLDTENYAEESRFATFDFLGAVANNRGHINKWIIDETAHMPVHGSSFGARLDFPGAGSVTIAQTKRSDGKTLHGSIVTTSVNDSARQYTEADAIATVTLTAEVNDGYHFAGWYRTNNWFQNIPYTSLDGWKEMVTGNIPDGTYFEGTNLSYAAPAEDDDFYLGHFQAEIRFMPLDGTSSGTPTATVYYDYMDTMGDNSGYRSAITKVQSDAVEAGKITAENGVFAGWTTKEGGIADAGLVDLSTLGSEFYGQATIVTEPLVLYPVFIQDASKIVFTTIEAGTTDKDGNENQVSCFGNNYGYNTRVLEQYDANEKYTASVDFVNQEDGSYKCILSLKDSEGNKITDDSAWESGGYRFLGWYRIETDNRGAILYDENGKKNAARISRELEAELPTETALSGIRLYEARFEYEVQYWEQYYLINYFCYGTETRVEWYEYGETFKNFDHHIRPKGTANGWYTGPLEDKNSDGIIDINDVDRAKQKEILEAFSSDTVNAKDEDNEAPFNGTGVLLSNQMVQEPFCAFYNYEPNDTGRYAILLLSEFPSASSYLQLDITTLSYVQTKVAEKEGYHFWGWTQQRIGDNSDNETSEFFESTNSREVWKANSYLWSHYVAPHLFGDLREYALVAHFYADVNFIKKDSNFEVVNRRYLDKLFLSETKNDVTYTLWDNDLDPDTGGSPSKNSGISDSATSQTMIDIQASPSDEEMAVPGYKFLGWIDAAEIGYDASKSYEEQSYMYRYIYDNPDDSFVTMHENRTEGLLWRSTDDIQVTQTMTLIPVYTYDFTVSVASNLSSLSSSLDYRILRNDENTGFDIYLATSADINTTDYPFTGWYDGSGALVTENLDDEVADFTILDTAVTEELTKSSAKPAYTFTANFNIRTTYHDSGAAYEDIPKFHVPNKVLGTTVSTLKPEETPVDSYFIGWTTESAAKNKDSSWSFTDGEYYVIKSLDDYGVSQYKATGNSGGLADFLLTGEEIVQSPMDIYPVYIHLDAIKDNITVYSNMSEDTTTKLGLDESGLYLETAYANEDYMLVDWKESTDNSNWSFFTTFDTGATKYYISMPALDKVLDIAKDNVIIDYYRADYGVKITYCGLTNDVLYEHGLLVGETLSTYADGKFEYYREVPMDIMTYYVASVGERFGTLSYSNRMYTKESDGTKKSFVAYMNQPITQPLTFYLDIYMVYTMDNTETLCSLSDFKIGFAEDGSMNAYLLEDYTKSQYAQFLVGINEMNNGEQLPVGQNDVTVNLYLQKSTEEAVSYGLYKSTTTAEHEGVSVSGISLTQGIAEFDILGTLQLSMDEVEGYIEVDDETFFLCLVPPADSGAQEMKVAIQPGETITISNLVFGEWTVKQDTAWAWRYDVVGNESIDVNVDSVWAGDTITEFDNDRNEKLNFTDEEKLKP